MTPRSTQIPPPLRRYGDQQPNGSGGQIDPTSYLLAEHNTQIENLSEKVTEIQAAILKLAAVVDTIKDWTDTKQAGEVRGQQRRVIFETAVAEAFAGAGVLVLSPHLTLSAGQSNILLATVAAIVAAVMLLWRWGI